MANLRTPEDMFTSDMLSRLVDENTGAAITVDAFFSRIKDISLNPSCPSSVIKKFDNARNLYLYSFYNYEFCMNARAELVVSLEFALKERALMEKLNLENYKGLNNLIELAIKKGWIIKEDLPGIKPDFINMGDFRKFIHFFRDTRNELAHGSRYDIPTNSG